MNIFLLPDKPDLKVTISNLNVTLRKSTSTNVPQNIVSPCFIQSITVTQSIKCFLTKKAQTHKFVTTKSLFFHVFDVDFAAQLIFFSLLTADISVTWLHKCLQERCCSKIPCRIVYTRDHVWCFNAPGTHNITLHHNKSRNNLML